MNCMKRLPTVFSLGSLTREFQMVYILLSVGGSILIYALITYRNIK